MPRPFVTAFLAVVSALAFTACVHTSAQPPASSSSVSAQPSRVTLTATSSASALSILSGSATPAERHWQLHLNDDPQPYLIRGVTFSGTGGPAAYDRDMERIASLGVNTIRTWGTGADTRALLDAAHRHGLHVLLGLWFRHGQPGAEADDHFDYTKDTAGIAAQQASVLAAVRTYKDHPALLAWGVGNEVFLNLPNDDAKTAYALALEAACSEIKRLDPHHPLVAVDAFDKGVRWIERYCPSVDIHGINVYGPGLAAVAPALAKANSTRPWLITEYGSRGDWDTPKDKNGVKLESSDDDKYRVITDAWTKTLREPRETGRCLGLFVFNYSNSFTYTNLKHGLLLNDSFRPAWHAVHEAYTGEKPAFSLLQITGFIAKKHSTSSAPDIEIQLYTNDASGQPLDISFAYNLRAAAARSERDAVIPLVSRPGPTPHTWLITPPPVSGALKLYALVRDSHHTVTTATTSIILPLSQ